MEVRLHPAASQELVDAAERYAAQAGRRVAQDFVADYDEVRLRVVENPRIDSPSLAQTRKPDDIDDAMVSVHPRARGEHSP
jgi:hypothetical protein